MAKKGWYERKEIPLITQDWVTLNCKNITKREKELLKIINERNLVRRDHLEIIHESFRKMGKYRTNIINRSIKKLFEKSCIDKCHEETDYGCGNLPAVLAIDRAGAILLGNIKKFRRKIRHINKSINETRCIFRELPNNYPHIHGVNELEVQTILLCDELNLILAKWDLEELNTKIFMYNERYVLTPDVFLGIRVGKRPLFAFIEYDTGTEDFGRKDKYPTIREKLEKYSYYKLCKSWKQESWAKYTAFPLLIFVCEDKKRIPFINKTGKALGLKILATHSSEYVNALKTILKPLQSGL